MAKITLTIDDQLVEAEAGSMLIEAADQHGIAIPRFCYHKKLSIPANCRMCLIEVVGSKKTLPACATPVVAGMKVKTCSDMAKQSQKAVMEFLLINHPLDCPICDQGGECELQDLSLGYGQDFSHFGESKRVVHNPELGSLIATDMTRCIHCTRCVRFSDEIAGIHEIGATGRGEHTHITNVIEKTLSSEISGNIIDLCPVGALTSKPFRFSARTWELIDHAGVSTHDGYHSHLYWQTKEEKLLRVVARENEAVNEIWLSDRDRFSYAGLDHADRITVPMKKQTDGSWQELTWMHALEEVVRTLKMVAGQYGTEQVAVQVHPSTTTEEGFLLQQWLRTLGINHIDHRLLTPAISDNQSTPIPSLSLTKTDLLACDEWILVGCHLREELPLLAITLRQTVAKGAHVSSFHPSSSYLDLAEVEEISGEQQTVWRTWANCCAAVIKGTQKTPKLKSESAQVDAKIVKTLSQRWLSPDKKRIIIIGQGALGDADADQILAWANQLSAKISATVAILPEGGNHLGLWSAGVIPHGKPGFQWLTSPGLGSQAMVEKKPKAWFLYGIEPEYDAINNGALIEALQAAEQVIACSAYLSPALKQHASLILPLVPTPENEGSVINLWGGIDSFSAARKPLGSSRPGWKLLRVLGTLSQVDGFDYQTVDEVHQAWLASVHVVDGILQLPADRAYQSLNQIPADAAKPPRSGWALQVERSMIGVDGMTRRSEPLLASFFGTRSQAVRLHPDSVVALNLGEHDELALQYHQGLEWQLPWIADSTIAQQTLVLQQGVLPQLSIWSDDLWIDRVRVVRHVDQKAISA